MKKKHKVLLGLLTIILIAGGYIFMKYQENKKEEDIYFTKQEKRIKLYLKYNMENVNTVIFTERKTTPMGTPYVHGYVNNDKKNLYFSAYMDNNNEFDGNFGYSQEFGNLFYSNRKSMSEIEKIEKEKALKNK